MRRYNMAFQQSPGINVTEIDLTTVVPAVSTTTGAIAGVFAWGATNEPILVSSEVDLVKRFGKPVSTATWKNTETFFTAADFLAYGNSLYVVRVSTGNIADPASIGSTGALVGFKAKYPGSLGNSLQIMATDNQAYASANSTLKAAVSGAPSANSAHVVVIDTTGSFSGIVNSVIEVFEDVSLLPQAKKEDGTNNYIADVINAYSNYIKLEIGGAPGADTTYLLNTQFVEQFADGTDGDNEDNIAINALETGYDYFKNPENIDVSLIMQGVARGINNIELASYIINMAQTRTDALAFISPARADVVGVNESTALSSVSGFATALSGVVTSSYGVVDSGYKYRYDRYNDKYLYTPLNGDIAGLCARTDDTRDPWFSPAGYNRGGIKNIIKLAYNPGKADRDALYKLAVNSVITQSGQGTVLFGDKTFLLKPSAFDRINVRRLFIVLEKAISRASKSTLFEFNDEFTRAQFRNLIEPFLRDVEGRRGIYNYRVICDESNNTPEVIDRNEFVGDIYIKPARAINFIQLNFVAVRTGIEFEEIIGLR